MEGLLQCSANYVPLAPVSLLGRAALVYGNKTPIISGNTRNTWRQTHERCLKLASALTRLKISHGDIELDINSLLICCDNCLTSSTNTFGLILLYKMGKSPMFLWTVDMFRCGTALGGINVCVRNMSTKIIFDSIQLHKITHLYDKPTFLNTIAESAPVDQKSLPSVVDVIIAGAFPMTRVLKSVQELGLNIIHGCGMTEAIGPSLITPWRSSPHHHHDEDEDDHDDHNLKYREGLHNITLESADVKDPTTMRSVLSDGETIGEVMLRRNNLMACYLGDPEVTGEAFSGGWYRTGDIGLQHADGCIEMKDRVREAIVFGNEISTLCEKIYRVKIPTLRGRTESMHNKNRVWHWLEDLIHKFSNNR